MLHIAAQYGYPETQAFLHEEQGFDLSELNAEQETPAHLAAKAKNALNMRYLLSRRVDINKVNNAGKTPLMLAIDVDSRSIIQEFKQAQISLVQINPNGEMQRIMLLLKIL